jgi:hypothetical protein
MVNVDDTNFLLVSKASGGQCLEQVKQGRGSNEWDAYASKDCNTGNANQKIQLIEAGGDFSFKTGADNYMVVTGISPSAHLVWGETYGKGETSDDVRALWEGDRSGTNGTMQQHGWFKIYGTGKNTGKSGRDALINGPVKIGSSHFHWKRFHMEDVDNWKGERLRNFDNNDSGDSNIAQTFIHYGLLQKCNERGISFDDCTKGKLEDCSDTRNHNITVCPKEYCTKPENVSKPECRTICDTQNGLCDAAANDYCSTEPGKSTDFCSCFGPYPPSDIQRQLQANGHTLRRECNLAKCVEGGYKTQAMRQQTCSPLQICIQGIETGAVGGSSQFSNITINCNQSNAPVPPPSAANASSNTQAAEDAADDDEDDEDDEDGNDKKGGIPPIYFAIGGIVVFLLLLMFMFRG